MLCVTAQGAKELCKAAWAEPAAMLRNLQAYFLLQPLSRLPPLWVEGVVETTLESEAFVFLTCLTWWADSM